MKRYLLFISFMLCVTSLLKAQPGWNLKENDVWVFPYHMGLDFNGNSCDATSFKSPPSTISSAIQMPAPNGQPSTAVADRKGNLLFYTGTDTIWDRYGHAMPNGVIGKIPAGDIFPVTAGEYGGMSTGGYQGCIILPVLNDPNQYYVFTLNGNIYTTPLFGNFDDGAYRLKYSIVDMSLNNGNGDVIKKNIVIDSLLSGGIRAVRGDSCNIWLIVHEKGNNLFKAYEIKPSGINTNPVISSAGNFSGSYAYYQGEITISPNRKKIALLSVLNGTDRSNQDYQGFVELYDFDPQTGSVSNAQVLSDTSILISRWPDQRFFIYTSVVFSPDNSKLYCGIVGAYSPSYGGNIFQWDLSLSTLTAIRNSFIQINDSGTSVNGYRVILRLAPDGKIYAGTSNNLDSSVNNKRYYTRHLSVINNPNNAGAACNFSLKSFAFPPVRVNSNIPPSASDIRPILGNYDFVKPIPQDSSITRHLFCLSDLDSLVLKPTDYPSFWYQWDDCSGDSIRVINQAGTYWCESGDYCRYVMDTFVVTRFIPPVINVNGFVLSTTVSYNTYQWILDGKIVPGATQGTYPVEANGDYQVIVTDSNGCRDTSAVYAVNNYTGIEAISVLPGQINVYPNPATDIVYIQSPAEVNVILTSVEGRTIREIKDAKHISVNDLAAGVYLLRVTDRNNMLIKVVKVAKAIK